MTRPLKRGVKDPERKAEWRGAGLLTRVARGSKPPGSSIFRTSSSIGRAAVS
jgi:hypothetical protein